MRFFLLFWLKFIKRSHFFRQQRIRQRAQQTAAIQEAQAVADINPEFLAALPLNIQEEVLAQQRLEQQRQAAAAANPNDPVNTAEFFQNLQPSLRQAVSLIYFSTKNTFNNWIFLSLRSWPTWKTHKFQLCLQKLQPKLRLFVASGKQEIAKFKNDSSRQASLMLSEILEIEVSINF